MNVLDIMSSKVVAIYKTDSLAKACSLMTKKKTRHLAVIESDGSLVGIISDRDCKEAEASPYAIYDDERAHAFAEKITVERIMTASPTCISPQASVQEAAHLMVETRINSLPVLQDGRIIGIVTSTDLLKVLANLSVVVNA